MVGVIAGSFERRPPAIGYRLARARAGVEVSPACGTQAAAVLTTLDIRRCGQEPLFADGRPQIEAILPRVEHEHIRIFQIVGVRFDEHEVRRLLHIHVNIGQAAPALAMDCSSEPSAEIIPSWAGGREPPGDPDARDRYRIMLLPHWVAGFQYTIDCRSRRRE